MHMQRHETMRTWMVQCLRMAACLAPLMWCAPASSAAPRVGEVPPPYVGEDADGQAVDLSAQAGKVVVVTFWASWCGPCLKELPILENVQRQAGDSRLRVIAVNIDEDRDDRRRMKRQLKDFELMLTTDVDKRARSAYGVSGIPHMVMIDHLGEVAFRHVEYSEKTLPRIVEELNVLLEDAEAAVSP